MPGVFRRQFYGPRRRRVVAFTATSGTSAISATIAAVATLTATLTGAGALAATIASTATLSATLSGAGALSTTIAASGSLSGTLAGAGALAGESDAVATLSATLGGAGALAATSAAVATLTASLSGTYALNAECDAVATATGTLAGTGALAGSIAASATTTAVLGGAGALSATCASTSSCTGTLANFTGVVGGWASYGADFEGVPKRVKDTRPLFWREARRAARRAAMKRAGLIDGVPEAEAPRADAVAALVERIAALEAAGQAAHDAAQPTAQSAETPPVADVQAATEPATGPTLEVAPAGSQAFGPVCETAQTRDPFATMRFTPAVDPPSELPVAVSVFPLLPTGEPTRDSGPEFLEDCGDFVPVAAPTILVEKQDIAAPDPRLDAALARLTELERRPPMVERVIERRDRVEVRVEPHAAREPGREPRERHAARLDAPKVITRRVQRADPVHPVMTGGKITGYQWGSHGKVYKTKAKAQEQAAAIYAAGWRGDGTNGKRARGILATALAANKAAELHYTREVVALFKGVHRGIIGMVDREILPETEVRQNRLDARTAVRKANDLLNARLNKKIAKHLRDRVGPLYDLMAKRVGDKNAQAMTMLGIPIRDAAAGVAAKVAVARENNLRLIEDAGRAYADDVRDVISDPANEGLRAEELRDQLVQRGTVSVSRATLIAIDQTLKLSAAINQARQTAAGVERYKWSTSRDERVRPDHADLEGQVFDWDDPPVTDQRTGARNHAGQDYRCRCVSIPLIAGLDEEAEDEEPEDAAAE